MTIGAELVDHQPDPGHRQPRDPLPGLGVGRVVVVRPNSAKTKKPRDGHVGRVDRGQPGEQPGAEVEVDAVRLLAADAQLAALAALGFGERVGGLGALGLGGAVSLGGLLGDARLEL